MQTIVTPNHPSAPATQAPSRDMATTFGLGTARREDANMLASRKNVSVSLAGFTQPKWRQGAAIENKGGVLPHSKPANVIARSGNQTNLAQIGLADDNTAQVSVPQNENLKNVLNGGQLTFIALAAWAAYKMIFGKSRDD